MSHSNYPRYTVDSNSKAVSLFSVKFVKIRLEFSILRKYRNLYPDKSLKWIEYLSD